MRTGIALLLLSGVAIAHASFELVLATDYSTSGSAVRRYDGLTGIYLGSFGEGLLSTPTGIALDQANNMAFVNDNPSASVGRVSKWNYNTGEFLGSFLYTKNGVASLSRNSDGTLNVVTPGSALRFAPNGAVVATYLPGAGISFISAIQTLDGSMFLTGRNAGGSGRLEAHNYSSGALQTTFAWFADYAARLSGSTVLNGYSVGSTVGVEYDSWSSTSVTGASFVLTSHNAVTGIAVGHNNLVYVSGTTPTGSIIQRLDASSTTMVLGTTFGTNLTNCKGIAVVVAPEPVSLTILLPGLVAVMRRRRNR